MDIEYYPFAVDKKGNGLSFIHNHVLNLVIPASICITLLNQIKDEGYCAYLAVQPPVNLQREGIPFTAWVHC